MDQTTLNRLIGIGRGLLSELDVDAVLARVLAVARELTGAQYAALGVLDARRTELERFITSGIAEETTALIGDPPRGHGVLGLLIDDPRPLRLDDVSAHARSYGFPLNHPSMRTFLGVPVVIRGEAWGNLYLTEKASGEPFTELDEQAMVVLADWAAIAIENARLYQAATARRDELERTVHALETTTEIQSAIGGEIALDRILELVVKRGRALVSARTLVVSLVDGDELHIAAAAGEVPDGMLGRRAPLNRSVMGTVVRSRRPERLTDLNRRAGQPLIAELEARAGLMVPLMHRDRPLGVLGAFDRLEQGPEFSADDVRLLLSFAASSAIAVAAAQSAESYSMARSIRASEAERRRWARELHDETLQELGALRMLLSSARRSGDPARVERTLDDTIELVTGSIKNLRALITDLRPAALDELGIEAALAALAARVHTTSSLEVELELDFALEAGRAEHRLVEEVEEAVYRTVQEALTNAVKHGSAEVAHVAIREEATAIAIVVRDDGHGFDPDAATEGFGLLGMRERVALVGGALTVRSSQGEGTTIEVTIPVKRRAADSASTFQVTA